MSKQQNFKVDRILDKRVKNGQAWYKVKWHNFSIKESTWEPIANLTCALDLVDAFERQNSSSKHDTEYLINQEDQISEQSHISVSSSEEKQLRSGRKIKHKTTAAAQTKKSPVVHKKITKTKRKLRSQDHQIRGESHPKSLRKRLTGRITKRPQCPSTDSDCDESSQSFKNKQHRKSKSSSSEEVVVRQNVPKNQRDKYMSSSESAYIDEDEEIISSSPEYQQKSRNVTKLPKEVLDIKKDHKSKRVDFYVSWKPIGEKRALQPTWVSQEYMSDNASLLLSKYLLGRIRWDK